MVMKGGITSGVVYPLAVTKLAERFVFKNIGGTSAGAIAAAATAAAELGRDTGGFERLAQCAPNIRVVAIAGFENDDGAPCAATFEIHLASANINEAGKVRLRCRCD